VQQWTSPSPTHIKTNDTGYFSPQNPVPVSYSDAEVSIEAVSRNEHAALRIVEKNGHTGEVDMPSEVEQINVIRRVQQDVVVVLGMNNGDLSDVTVVQLSTGKILDKFFCYLPSLSPDGRYIAFVKFYPTHPGIPVEDHYMLYDTSKSPAENRPIGIPTTDWMNVGTTVYPMGVANAPFDNYRKADHSVAFYRFIWSPDSQTLLFADRSHSSIAVVRIALGSYGKSERISVFSIPAEKMCPHRENRSDCEMNLTAAGFGSSDSVSLKFTGVGIDRNLSNEYRVSYSEFR
jgi:hypothetical protein